MAEEHVFRLAVRNLAPAPGAFAVEEGWRFVMGVGLPLYDEKVEGLRSNARLAGVGVEESVRPLAREGLMNSYETNKYASSLCMVVYDHDKAKAKGFTDQDMFEWLMIVEDWLYSLGAAHISKGVGYGDSLGIKNHISFVVYWKGDFPSDTLLADVVMKEQMKAAHFWRLDEHEPTFLKGVFAAWRYRDLKNLERYKFMAKSALEIAKASGLKSFDL